MLFLVVCGSVLALAGAVELFRRVAAPSRTRPREDDAAPLSRRSAVDVLIVVCAVAGLVLGLLGIAAARSL